MVTYRSNQNRFLFPKQDVYARPGQRVEYQLFSQDYFSGADVKIYFGNIWIDDATAIQFQLAENVMPIYGYNSYTYDTVVRGNRIVQGTFNVNFTSVGYLHQVIENAHAIFYALEKGEKDGLIPPEYYENKRLDEILEELGKESFDQIADEYEKALWGEQEDTKEYLSYASRPFFRQDDVGFDIRIQYGAISESTGVQQQQHYEAYKAKPPNTTVDVINGVQITSMGKAMGTDQAGMPIQESYSFIARDVNGVSFTQLRYHNQKHTGSRTDLGTVYRPMQYGPVR